MITMKSTLNKMTPQKREALINLLGLEDANQILAQAEATEKSADMRGLKYKELQAEQAAPFDGVPGYLPPAQTGIGAVLGSGK